MQSISLKLPDALLRQLESEARLRRVTKSHLVRASLEKALAEGREDGGVSCYDLASDLAGKLKGLPKDLATNPAYLKEERARLIDALWDSLSLPEVKAREAAWAKESERRIDAFEAGKLPARDAAGVFSKPRKGLRK